MLIQDYERPELSLAYCYHAYLHWRTFRLRKYPALANLDQAILGNLIAPQGVHVLECNSSPTEVRILLSMKPEDSISAAASKVKGRVSRWLREALGLEHAEHLLSKGYFACTCRKSKSEEVDKYLDNQAEHHGYSGRALPPVYVEAFSHDPEETVRANHAFTRLQLHVVFASWRRRGVFAAPEATAVTRQWQTLQAKLQFLLLKVSFVPDHVHIALRVHPSVAPAELIVELMNAAQRVLFEKFPEEVIRAKLERLWQPSAYLGSFGDLASPQIQAYMRDWKADGEK